MKRYLILWLLLSPLAAAQEFTAEQEKAAAQAVALLDEAAIAIDQIEPPQQQILAMRTVASAYVRAGQEEKARKFLRAALRSFVGKEGLPEHLRSRAVAEASMVFANLGATAEAVEAAALLREELYRPTVVAMVASAYARAGDTAAAFAAVASLSNPRSRDSAYRMVATGCLSQRDFACAEQAVQAIADPSLKTQVLGQVARAKVRAGARAEAAADVELARNLAESLPDSGEQRSGSLGFVGCVPSVRQTPRDAGLREAAEMQASLGDFAAARETLRSIRDPEVKENVLVTLVMGVARERDFPLALSLAGEVLRPDCNSLALSWIAYYQYRAGDEAGAKRTAEQIPSVNQRVHALMNIAGLQWRREPEVAALTLSLASQLALQAPDEAERLDLLLGVARRQFAVESSEPLAVTLRAARSLAAQPAPPRENRLQRNWNGLLVALTDLLAETGDIASAEEVARRMEPGMDPTATIARATTRGGNLEAARAWASSLPTPGQRTLALIGMAIGTLDRAHIGRTPGGSIL